MSANTTKPVLVIGGSGAVGSRAVRTLRRLQPDLPITIAARDLCKADSLAKEIGNANTVKVDLERKDLGLAADAAYSAVVVLLKDHALNTMKYAQAKGVPYLSFSDFAFDIAPEVALYIQKPASSPVLMLGHFLGGTVTMATLYFAKEFKRIHAIDIGAVFDSNDMGGPVAQEDIERLGKGTPNPLLRKDGKWLWTNGEDAVRNFIDVDGIERKGQAYPLLDVVSLATATDAQSIRVDLALREGARQHGGGPSHEVIIEITGEQKDGTTGRVRYEIIDDDVYSALSARGAALAVERLLGLAGGPPVAAGLYHPEGLLDPSYVVERLREFGTQIRRV